MIIVLFNVKLTGNEYCLVKRRRHIQGYMIDAI